MLFHDPEKTPKKINKRITNSGAPLSIRTSHHTHRRAIFATICIILVVAFGIFMENSCSNKTVAYADSVSGLGASIYWDQSCSNKTLSLDWGPVGPGSNTTLTIYIRNEGNSAVSLQMTASNWTPSAALSYMNLNWNYSGQILNAGQVIPLQLTLSVSPTASGINNFSFNTIITATS